MDGSSQFSFHTFSKNVFAFAITVLSLLILAGCSPVKSSDRETNEISMEINTEIDGELNETRFIIKLTDATSSPSFGIPPALIELTRRDKVFVSFGDERYQVRRYTGGQFIATVPGIRTGEYRVDFDREKHISAPDSVITINSHPTLLAPLNDSIYSVGENIELVWETRDENGPLTDIVRHTGWGIRDFQCIDETGSEITEYDRDQTYFRFTPLTDIQFNGIQASQLINTNDLFEQLERSNQTETPISWCNLEINSRGRFRHDSLFADSNNELSVKFSGDQNLAYIVARGENISNTASITLISNVR